MNMQNNTTMDGKRLRTLALVLAVAGLIILFRLPPLRMFGFVLIGAGAFGLIWSLLGSNKTGPTKEEEDHRNFFR
jgi:hypothetical protein